MDSFTFEDIFEQERPQRATASKNKQAKRKWREIEAIKEKQRLHKELQDIDMLSEVDQNDVDF